MTKTKSEWTLVRTPLPQGVAGLYKVDMRKVR
jgi:hypothetical protein